MFKPNTLSMSQSLLTKKTKKTPTHNCIIIHLVKVIYKYGLNLVLWLVKPLCLLVYGKLSLIWQPYVTEIQHKHTQEHSSQKNAQTNNIIVNTTRKQHHTSHFYTFNKSQSSRIHFYDFGYYRIECKKLNSKSKIDKMQSFIQAW